MESGELSTFFADRGDMDNRDYKDYRLGGIGNIYLGLWNLAIPTVLPQPKQKPYTVRHRGMVADSISRVLF